MIYIHVYIPYICIYIWHVYIKLCGDNCLINFMKCKCCDKQFVGKATDKFCLRWNNCKSNGRENEGCIQEYMFEKCRT